MGGNLNNEDARPSVVRRAVDAAKGWLTSSPRHVGYAVVLAALALTVPFGGLRPAAQPSSTTPAGQPVDVAPWRVTLDEVIWGEDLGGEIFPASHGGPYAMLVATVRNTSDEPLGLGAQSSELAGTLSPQIPGLVDGLGQPATGEVMWDAAGTYVLDPVPQLVGGLSPGLDYRVGVLFRTSQASPPGSVPVLLSTRQHVDRVLGGGMWWSDPTPTTTVQVPVRAVDTPPWPELPEGVR